MSNKYKKKFMGKQVFYDDKARENVVSYYLMEDQEHTMYTSDIWSGTEKKSGRCRIDRMGQYTEDYRFSGSDRTYDQ